MTLGEIYIAPRSLIAFGTELLWLVLSASMLCAIGNASINTRIASISLISQTAIIIAIYLSIFYLMDLYQQDLLEPGPTLFLNLTQAGCLVFVTIGGLEIWTKLLPFEPLLTFGHFLLTAAFVLCARATIREIGNTSGGRPTIHVGIIAGEATRQALQAAHSRKGSTGLQFAWLGGSLGEAQAALESRSISRLRIRQLAIEPEILDDSTAAGFLQQWRTNGVCFEDVQSFAERINGKIILGTQMARGVVSSRSLGPSRINTAVRRARDFLLASLGLLVASPLNLITMLAIKLESPGPALFRQERIGENGQRFVMLKFRSMYLDMKTATGREWTTHEADPRITRVGSVIRLLHIDEIPQLINVLRGEMSLVGPRPFHPDQVAELESQLPSYGLRHLVRPGITGWAQITCDYDASLHQKAEVFARDLYYVKHAGLLFDLLIMVATIRVCLWRRGAR
jgi:exopolysaccharide biosynthesis polyprenyl glycosylphosphotransferase